jgi:hypothetical protein
MKHEGVVTADILQWTCLVLAVLKAPLFMRRKRDFQAAGDALGNLTTALQPE